MQKRIVSLLLVLVMLVSLFPAPARAAETDSNVDSSDVTIEGTNGFGTLLSEDIQTAYEEETRYDGGYSVLGLEIEGSTAMVEYSTLEEAVLVVALYTEDGLQLLTSGKTTVDPTEDIATVTIEGDMPEYFQASAYLVDTYDFSPLCASYDTPMYTREMQELLASTVEDYDADRVLQLDEDKTTNFAVYAEDTIVIEEQPGVNTVASVNDETSTYVIENADESITSLREGDIFAYPYGDNEILIVKVASISVENGTATITGADMEMEEAFQAVKIEGQSGTEDIIVDDSTADEGITYLGLRDDGASTFALEGGGSAKAKHVFDVSIKAKETSEHLAASLAVSGSLTVEMNVSVKYYISFSRRFVEFKATPKVALKATVNMNITTKLRMGSLDVFPVPGVFVGFEPELQVEFDGKIELAVTLSATIGVGFDNTSGVKNLSSKPDLELDINAEGKLFVGVDFLPRVVILDDSIANITLNAMIGVQLDGKVSGTGYEIYDEGAASYHQCRECLGIDILFKAELTGSLAFLEQDWLTVTVDIGKWQIDLGKAYWSPDIEQFGWGSCPYLFYRTTIVVCDKKGNPVPNAVIMLDGIKDTTNRYGVIERYFPSGSYYASALFDHTTVSIQILVEDKAQRIVIYETGKPKNVFDTNKVINKENDFLFIPVIEDALKKCNYPSLGIKNRQLCRGLLYDLDDDGKNELILKYVGDINMEFEVWDIEEGIATCINTVSAFPGGAGFNGALYQMQYGGMRHLVYRWFNSGSEYWQYLTMVYSKVDTSYQYNRELTNQKEWNEESILETGKILLNDTQDYGQDLLEMLLTLQKETVAKDNSVIPAPCLYVDKYSPYNTVSIQQVEDNKVEYVAFWYRICDMFGTAALGKGNRADFSYAGPGLNWIASGYLTFSEESVIVSVIESTNEVFGIGDYQFDLLGEKFSDNKLIDIRLSLGVPDELDVSITQSAPLYWEDGARYLTDVQIWFLNEIIASAQVDYFTGEIVKSISHYSSYTKKYTGLVNAEGIGMAIRGAIPLVQNQPTVYGAYEGVVGTEELEDYTLKTASFTGLVPNEEYLLLALAKLDTEDPLAVDNLLYIDQAAAGADGKLNFEYVQQVNADISYVMACGPSNQNLNNATITFPDMIVSGELQAVDPVVVYDGKTLTEGVDYILLGDVSFTEAGSYTCFIRGIHQYTGLVECSYRVTEHIPMENPFEDVFEADYYYDPVLWAVSKGITNGMDATHFAPGGTCTRAQIVTFLWRANGSPASGGTNPFTDVPADAWYTNAVLWAVEKGITTGTSATTFSPDAGCTRGQVATFLWRSQGQPSVNGENIFTDIAPGAYYYDAVLWAVDEGITNGMGEGLFAPDATCTRGQIVTFLYRAMK